VLRPPAGSLDGIRMVGGGDATVPTGGAFGVHFFPLAGYGGMSPTAWSYLLYSEDGAAAAPEASGFASIGAQGTGNSQPSQAIVARARSSGGVDVGGFLQLAAPGNWFAAPSLLIGGLADLAQPIDANALLETYVSANSFRISGVLKNNSGGGSAGVGLGLNVTNSVASEASVSKGGLFMLRTTTKGRGTVGIANRITDDSSPFDPAADTVASWDAAGACKQMINGTLYTLSVVAGVVHAT
jgi:hypothetical protein